MFTEKNRGRVTRLRVVHPVAAGGLDPPAASVLFCLRAILIASVRNHVPGSYCPHGLVRLRHHRLSSVVRAPWLRLRSVWGAYQRPLLYLT